MRSCSSRAPVLSALPRLFSAGEKRNLDVTNHEARGLRLDAAASRLDLKDLVLDRRDPCVDRLFGLFPRAWFVKMIHARGFEDGADMVHGQAVKLFEQEQTSVLGNLRMTFAAPAGRHRDREIAAA